MSEAIETQLRRHGLELGSIPKRAVAFMIDEFILSSLFLVVIWESVSQATDFGQFLFITNAYALEYLGLKVLYQTFFVALYGATPGKKAVKIRVVFIESATTPSWGAAFNRAIFRLLSEIIFYLGFFWALFDSNNQGWHDRTAGTVVVNG